jgi:hypothetical protein
VFWGKPLHRMQTALFPLPRPARRRLLIAVKHSHRKGFQLIKDQLTYGRRIPWRTSKQKAKQGRDITSSLQAMPAPEWVVEQWPCSETIINGQSHCRHDGKPADRTRYQGSSLRTDAKFMLKAVRQRLPIENNWHWVRDVPLGEDAHRYREVYDV